MQPTNSHFSHADAPDVRSVSPIIIISRPSSENTDTEDMDTRKLITTALDQRLQMARRQALALVGEKAKALSREISRS